MTSTPKEHLRWVLAKAKGIEHVSFENFVEAFSLSDQKSATELFCEVISSVDIRKSRREALQDAFQEFRMNHEEVFWSERKLKVSTDIRSNNIATHMQEVAEKKSQDACREHLSNNPSNTQGPPVRTPYRPSPIPGLSLPAQLPDSRRKLKTGMEDTADRQKKTASFDEESPFNPKDAANEDLDNAKFAGSSIPIAGQKRPRGLLVELEEVPEPNPFNDDNDSETTTAATPSRTKLTGSPQKRKIRGFMLDLKEPTFPVPESPTTSLHVAFEKFRNCVRTKAASAPLDFSKCKGEALALNGIWHVGNVALDSPDVTQIHRAMRKDYKPPEYPEIADLTVQIEEILSFGTEEEIAREIDGMSDADLSWRARKALKVWRQLLDSLPSAPRPDQPNGEQTFVSQSLQPFLVATFSARGKMSLRGNVEHDSAYEDKREHRHGTRSDFFVTIPVTSLSTTLVCLIGEVKPPEVKSVAQEQMDQWKVFRMMKAEIDSQLKKGIENAVVWGCLIFDNEITFFVMDRRLAPIYTLLKAFTGTLPKSTQDISGVGRIISAFFFIESFMTKRVQELEARPSKSNVPLLESLQPNEITPKKKRQ